MVGRLAMLGVLLAACRSAAHLPGPDPLRAWPPPPERARVVLLGEVRIPRDLGIRRRGLGRILSAIAGASDGRLYRPYAVAVSAAPAATGPDGSPGPARLAVSDTEARVVHLFDLERGRYRVLSAVGETERLSSPVGVAFDGEGRLYVSDSALGAVVRYGADGDFDRVLSQNLVRPSGLAVDASRRRLYVADTAEHVVRRFDLDGTPRGALTEPLRFPTHLFLDRRGRLAVSDTMNFRAVVFGSDGAVLATVGKPGDSSGSLHRPKGVALDSAGHLYVVDALFDNLQIFDLEGRLLLAVGSAGDGPGEFALPAGLAIDEQDRVYVADSFNARVQIFRFVGGGKP